MGSSSFDDDDHSGGRSAAEGTVAQLLYSPTLDSLKSAQFKATGDAVLLYLHNIDSNKNKTAYDTSNKELKAILVSLGRCLADKSKEYSSARVISSLLDSMSTCDESKRKRLVARALRWLTLGWPQASIGAICRGVLENKSTERRTKLEAIEYINGVFSQQEQGKGAMFEVRQASCEMMPSLLLPVAKECSAVQDSSRYRRPTKLSVAAGDLLMKILIYSCEQAASLSRSPKSSQNDQLLHALWARRFLVDTYISLLYEWNRGAGLKEDSHLYMIGLADLKDALKKLCELDDFSPARVLALAAHLRSAGTVGLVSDSMSVESASKELVQCAAELSATPLGKELDTNDEDDCLTLRQLDEIARLQIRRICLVLGKLPPDAYQGVMDKVAPDLLQSCAKQMERRSPSLQPHSTSRGTNLANRVLAACLEAVLRGGQQSGNSDWDERVTSAYAPMLDLLRSRDSVANCCVQIVSKGALAHPQELMPVLLGMLASESSSVEEKVNVLAVLQNCVSTGQRERRGDDDGHNQGGPEEQRLLLLQRVMDQVGSASYALREPAGAVLGAMDPHFVIRHLCQAICDTSATAESRSVAAASLTQCFAHQVDTLAVFDVYLEHCDQERILDIAPRWAKHVPVRLWPLIGERVVLAMFANPGDTSRVGLARRLCPWFEKSENVLELVVSHLESQEDVVVVVASAGQQPKQLLLDRLSPLLFLRVLSQGLLQGISHTEIGERIAATLLVRMAATHEFKETRKMAAEIFARLSSTVTWPSLYELLRRFLANRVQVAVAKAAVVSMCSILMQRPDSPVDNNVLQALVDVLAIQVSDETSQHELMQLQQGCTQFFSLLVMANSEAWHAQALARTRCEKPIIDLDILRGQRKEEEEQDSSCTRSGPQGLHFVLQVANGMSQQTSTRICATNALVLAIRTAADAAGLLNETTKSIIPKTAATALDGLVGSDIVTQVIADIKPDDESRLMAARMQLLFTCCFVRSKLDSDRSERADCANAATGLVRKAHLLDNAKCCAVALAAMSHQADIVRLAALKLAGVLFSMDVEHLPQGSVGRLLHILRGIANLDANKQARHLAEELLKTVSM